MKTAFSQKQQGFTLVELLVALLVFSLLSGFAYRSISALSDMSAQLTEEEQQLKFMQQGISVIERDLRSNVSISIPEKNNFSVTNEIDSQTVVLLRVNLMAARIGKKAIEYHLADGILKRTILMQDSAEGSDKREALQLLSQLDSADMKLVKDNGGMAMGVELILDHQSLGKMTRLIQVPVTDLENIPALAKLNTLEYDVLASTGSGVGGGNGNGDPQEQPTVVRPSGPVKAEDVAIW